MPMFKKITQIYKEFGAKGIARRVIRLLKEQASYFSAARVNRYLLKKSGLYGNYVRFINDIKLTRQTQRNISSRGFRPIDQFRVQDYKKSDRVFILGSGSSVNDLTPADWEHVSLSDSIGFNFWMVHDFIPNVYFIEPLEYGLWETFLQLLELRKAHYFKTQFICNYKDWQFYEGLFPLTKIPKEIARNMYFYSPYSLMASSRKLVSSALWYWRFFKIDRAKLVDIIDHRATLSALIMFSVFAGYKEIVLVGVDLNDTAYFWETNSSIQYKIKPPNLQTGKIHRTADPEIDINQYSIPIDEYIYLLDRIILKPRGISLFIASDKSRLYPRLKKYSFPARQP